MSDLAMQRSDFSSERWSGHRGVDILLAAAGAADNASHLCQTADATTHIPRQSFGSQQPSPAAPNMTAALSAQPLALPQSLLNQLVAAATTISAAVPSATGSHLASAGPTGTASPVDDGSAARAQLQTILSALPPDTVNQIAAVMRQAQPQSGATAPAPTSAADSASDTECNTNCGPAYDLPMPALKRRRSSRGVVASAPPQPSPRRPAPERGSGAAALRTWKILEARRNITEPPMPAATMRERMAEAELSAAEVPILAARVAQMQREGASKHDIKVAQEELRLLRVKISMLRQVT